MTNFEYFGSDIGHLTDLILATDKYDLITQIETEYCILGCPKYSIDKRCCSLDHDCDAPSLEKIIAWWLKQEVLEDRV